MPADVNQPPEVVRFPDDYSAHVAAFLREEIVRAIAARGFCRLALSGGNTPRAIHEELVRIGGDLAWDHVQITFGDERCVPPEHADSNYRMARESLLDRVPIPPGNVFRIRGEIDPEAAAREYEARLAAVAARSGEPRYVHDVLLLGLGEDGHTASLFPESPALDERDRNVLPVIGPKPPPQRVTMTFPLINCARHVCFLVSGTSKREVVEQVLAGDPRHPASRVRAARVTWLVQ
jgi:6-phosphogluconolactonase